MMYFGAGCAVSETSFSIPNSKANPKTYILRGRKDSNLVPIPLFSLALVMPDRRLADCRECAFNKDRNSLDATC